MSAHRINRLLRSDTNRSALSLELKRLVCLSVFFGMFSLFSCAKAQQTHEAEQANLGECSMDGIAHHNGEVLICGPIELGLADLLAELVASHEVQRVVISSPGGWTVEAMKISDLLNFYKLPLYVREKCLSACAHFILMGTSDVTVEEGTFIGFHQTAFAILALVRQSGLKLGPSTEEQLALQAKIEDMFYGVRQMDVSMLVVPLRSMGVVCIEPIGSGSPEPLDNLPMRTRWETWTPSRSMIERARRAEVKGWWPTNGVEHRRSIPKDAEGFLMRFRYSSESEIDQLPDSFPQVTWCG